MTNTQFVIDLGDVKLNDEQKKTGIILILKYKKICINRLSFQQDNLTHDCRIIRRQIRNISKLI
ncbi:MAG: hypothetical protein JWO92_683 [Chitinophagaceae bacterium]|nr:hypothetical protein [Chitinophagaceae bacterium]MDB5222384.1 hypothetical protein [Chitinophagaceae bacterium]